MERFSTFVNDEKADLVLYFYRPKEKTTEKRNLLYFDKVLDFSYSPEGSRLVLSAVKDGITDIYIHTIASGTNEQITRDVPDDLYPTFLKDSPERFCSRQTGYQIHLPIVPVHTKNWLPHLISFPTTLKRRTIY